MKYLSYFLDNLLFGAILFLKKVAEAVMKEVTIKVEGMQCGMCESHVNDAVRKAANVKKVNSSHVDGKTVVVCDDDIDVEILKNAIQKDGYKVGDVSVKPYEKKGLFSFLKK